MANFRSFWEMTYFATHQRKWVWSLFEDSLVNTKQSKLVAEGEVKNLTLQ